MNVALNLSQEMAHVTRELVKQAAVHPGIGELHRQQENKWREYSSSDTSGLHDNTDIKQV